MIKLISDMKRMIYLLLMAMTAIPAVSQPKLTSRAINCFPTALPLTEDDIEWQRDIYREVDISENENAGLFCHDGMDDTQEPLFSIIFKLLLNAGLGFVALWIVNFFGDFVGLSIEMSFLHCVIVGFFGVPGVIVLAILSFLF